MHDQSAPIDFFDEALEYVGRFQILMMLLRQTVQLNVSSMFSFTRRKAWHSVCPTSATTPQGRDVLLNQHAGHKSSATPAGTYHLLCRAGNRAHDAESARSSVAAPLRVTTFGSDSTPPSHSPQQAQQQLLPTGHELMLISRLRPLLLACSASSISASSTRCNGSSTISFSTS